MSASAARQPLTLAHGLQPNVYK